MTDWRRWGKGPEDTCSWDLTLPSTLSFLSHHLPANIDFNLFDKLSPDGGECARWQICLSYLTVSPPERELRVPKSQREAAMAFIGVR